MSKAGDDDAWREYASGIKKLKKKAVAKRTIPLPLAGRAREGGVKADAPLPAKTKDLLRKPKFSLPLPQGERGITSKEWHTQIGKKAERDIRSGEIEIDARIDLHGMTQTKAHAALAAFIAKQVRIGNRNLLIITGKGKMGNGVLRSNLSLWLEALPEAGMISKLRPASVKHGGGGAFYVLLKKPPA